MFELVQG